MTYLLCVILVLVAIASFVLWRHSMAKRNQAVVAQPDLTVVERQSIETDGSIDERELDALEIPPVSIDGYDDLAAAAVLPSLETLSVEELRSVISHERLGLHRQAIIHRAELLIDLTVGESSIDRSVAFESPEQTRGRRAHRSPDATPDLSI